MSERLMQPWIVFHFLNASVWLLHAPHVTQLGSSPALLAANDTGGELC